MKLFLVSEELLRKIEESLELRCGTNAPERREILPHVRTLLDAPVALYQTDEGASEYYGKEVHACYDSTDIHFSHTDTLKLTEAIKQLRVALTELSWYTNQLKQIIYPHNEVFYHEIQVRATQILKDTENIK